MPTVQKRWSQLTTCLLPWLQGGSIRCVSPEQVAQSFRLSPLACVPTPTRPDDDAVSYFSSCLACPSRRLPCRCCGGRIEHRPVGGRAAPECGEGGSCSNSSDAFEFGSFESTVCSASLSFQSLGVIATSPCVQCFCCWDFHTHTFCHIINSQLGIDRQKQSKDTQTVKHMEKVGKNRFILCTFVEHWLHARHCAALGGCQHLHVLLTRTGGVSRAAECSHSSPGLGVYRECGLGKRRGEEHRRYVSLVSTGMRWALLGKEAVLFLHGP